MDRWTLITGASRGLGKAFAELCAQRGDNLLLISRDKDRLAAVATSLRHRYDIRILTTVCDLTDPAADDQILNWLKELQTYPNFIIHNAGFGTFGRFTELDPGHITSSIAIHTLFPFRFTRRILPFLHSLPSPTVLFISSTAGFIPVPYLSVYSGAKAFVTMAALALRYELQDSGVQICCCCPGPIATDFFTTAGMPDRPPFPLTAMKPEDVAEYTLKQVERNKALIIPGYLNRFIVSISSILPLSSVTWIAERIYRRMLSK